jgi:hypothetical protein
LYIGTSAAGAVVVATAPVLSGISTSSTLLLFMDDMMVWTETRRWKDIGLRPVFYFGFYVSISLHSQMERQKIFVEHIQRPMGRIERCSDQSRC